ncbi:MAG: thermosome subunit beta [Candidatus Thalassarchaeaceae archaeon]|jgi:thermosome|nr:thermosome subunit beta [Candidatus Thalassarchaeaceae archaeon]MDP7256946.1 thermosome subunit beta [Candidatus Thalassarchaeaceae archaeon]MDP7446648.1 thermosome subunit beta [Candidatus Thalassarchaeaceae archaeon]MDP7649227.1 thermosome subunit beta [Candidatus Thalassarchaeaceae archaeon]HJL54377.1 thermosome subunit beta [Candidatus Thalassarchaeaceae archaeon]|tara:strand:- start:4779 stop:6389 length:1611 start_codon:yes stop_codon:yes gene_type:complete
MYNGQQPIFILKEGTSRTSGKTAQSNNIAAAKAVADAVRSTLGPKGMDKMLVDSMGDVVITNDGATILKEMEIEHPAAKMIIEIAKTQDQHCHDGTTSAVVIAGELLKRSEDLVEQNVHPTVICEGFRLASDKAVELIDAHGADVNEKMLGEVSKTALTGKSAGAVKEFLSEISVKAVLAVAQQVERGVIVDLDDIKVQKKQGGSIRDSTLVDGIILDKERVHSGMPRSVPDAKIALVNSAIEVKKTEVDAKIQITDPNMLSQFLDEEEQFLRSLVDKIQASGANVVICQKGIDDLAQHHMAKAGIFAIRRAKKSDMEALSKATGGRIVTNIDDLSSEDLGSAAKTEERKIGDSDMVFIEGCPEAKSVSVLLRGGTEHVVDEVKRAFEDAIGVVAVAYEDGAVLTGGGSVVAALSRDLRSYAEGIGGREQMAIEAFSSALEVIPRTLAENAGLDPVNTIIDLRKAHSEGKAKHGVNVFEGGVADMAKAKVFEPSRVVEQAIQSASETAVMILRIDDVISSKSAGPMGEGEFDGMDM